MREEQWKLNHSYENSDPINIFFSHKELKDAIQAGDNTAPGRDYEMFKHLNNIVLDDNSGTI